MTDPAPQLPQPLGLAGPDDETAAPDDETAAPDDETKPRVSRLEPVVLTTASTTMFEIVADNGTSIATVMCSLNHDGSAMLTLSGAPKVTLVLKSGSMSVVCHDDLEVEHDG